MGIDDLKNFGKGPIRPLPPQFQSIEAMMKYMVATHHQFYATAAAGDVLKPMLFPVCANGEVMPIMAELSDQAAKDNFCFSMRILFRQWNVIRYCWASESWLASAGPKGQIRRASTAEDRKEVVFTICVDRTHWLSRADELVRDWSTGKVKELHHMPELDSLKIDGDMLRLFD